MSEMEMHAIMIGGRKTIVQTGGKKNIPTLEKDYEPFGPEWEREMMKLPKKIIIDMLKNEFKKSKGPGG